MDFGKRVYLNDDLQLIGGDNMVISSDFMQMIAFFESDIKEIVAKMQQRLNYEGRKFAPILPVIASRLVAINNIPMSATHPLWRKFADIHNEYHRVFGYIFYACIPYGEPNWRDFLD